MEGQTPTKASIHGFVNRDRPSGTDTLGFEPYVDAVAAFLTDDATVPPLTLSVEGEWGSGKTSFMKQLENRLKIDGYLTIWFDPWRHEKDEALWASFALDFIRQAAREKFIWFPNLRIRWFRFENADNYHEKIRTIGGFVLDLFFFFAIIAFPLVVAFLLNGPLAERLGWNTGLKLSVTAAPAAALTFLLAWLTSVRSAMVSILSTDLKRYVKDPKYQDHVSFLSRFHEDFKHLVSVYAKDRPICVFIDDLDRCEPGKAADLMHAINLMVVDDPPLYMVIGMDRAKIAASYAVKNEKLLDYLTGTGKAETEAAAARQRAAALDYGYTVIEKFIQLPFTVPTPTEANLELLLHQMIDSKKPTELGAGIRFALRVYDLLSRARMWMRGQYLDLLNKVRRWFRVKSVILTGVAATASVATQRMTGLEHRERRLEIDRAGDSDEVKAVARMVAPALDYNPRRLKQFVSLLRLRAWIAEGTGLFDEIKGPNPRRALTFPQLGKLIAIGLKWPALLADLHADPHLLKSLHRIVVGGEDLELPPMVEHWVQRPALRTLLKSGCFEESGLNPDLAAEYGLEAVDVKAVLQVSSLVPRPPKVVHLSDSVQASDSSETVSSVLRTFAKTTAEWCKAHFVYTDIHGSREHETVSIGIEASGQATLRELLEKLIELLKNVGSYALSEQETNSLSVFAEALQRAVDFDKNSEFEDLVYEEDRRDPEGSPDRATDRLMDRMADIDSDLLRGLMDLLGILKKLAT